MNCPRCTVKNPDAAQICSNCGQGLPANPFGALIRDGSPGPTATPTANGSSLGPAVQAPSAAGSSTGDPNAVQTPLKPAGFLILLLSALLGAPLVGLIYHFGAQIVDFLVVTPILFGFLLGIILICGLRIGKVRHARTVAVVAIVASCLSYGTKIFVDSVYVRETYISSKMAAVPGLLSSQNLPASSANTAGVEAAIRARTPVFPFFIEYLKAVGQSGISVTSSDSSSSSSSGSQVTGLGAYGLLALDVLVMSGIAAAIAVIWAKALYCVPCDRWYDRPKPMIRGQIGEGPALAEMAKERDWDSMTAFKGGKFNSKRNSTVLITSCPGCRLARVVVQTKNNNVTKTLYVRYLSADEATRLKSGRRVR